VEFTSLNKAYPKDPYLLPRIDQIVDSTAGCDLLCFLDAFYGYHQIKMAKEDEEKTAFITPCGVYCYICMPFSLKNAEETFQRLMRKALGAQMGGMRKPTSTTSSSRPVRVVPLSKTWKRHSPT
jgi:hypothetical protein